LRNKLFQLILITSDCLFQMESLWFLNEVWEEREARHILICWALSKEASGTIFIMSLEWRVRGSKPRPSAHGANALTTEPPLRLNNFDNGPPKDHFYEISSFRGDCRWKCLYIMDDAWMTMTIDKRQPQNWLLKVQCIQKFHKFSSSFQCGRFSLILW